MIEVWLVAKVWASKAWNFIKKYWQAFAGAIYAICVWIYFKGKVDNIKEVLDQQIIAKIEKKYEERKEELSEEKKAEVNKLVSKYREDPATLSRLLAERFGLRVE